MQILEGRPVIETESMRIIRQKHPSYLEVLRGIIDPGKEYPHLEEDIPFIITSIEDYAAEVNFDSRLQATIRYSTQSVERLIKEPNATEAIPYAGLISGICNYEI